MSPIPSPSDSAAAVLAVPPSYDLRRTLECGQVFRWTFHDGMAVGVVGGRVWTVRQEGRALRAWGNLGAAEAAALASHLAVDAPLGRIEFTLARDPVLRRVLPRTHGIALMRQDPWECLISYVISAFNNIPKIRLAVDALARRFGAPLGGEQFAFPAPARLAEAPISALRACILGYRAPYVRATARTIADGLVNLQELPQRPYAAARDTLLALPGVGEKVAECVLLFALGHGEAFPVDVWVQRAVQTAYRGGRRASPRVVRQWARERFGSLAGYANQHLFFAARNGLLTL
jgi:N-glycosylase/DNA lyase